MATAQTKSTDSAALKQQPSTGRLVSLDAFRGAIIALMALVKNPGDGATCTPRCNTPTGMAGLSPTSVFPSFVWIVGIAIRLDGQASGRRGSRVFAQALPRAAIL